MFNAIKKSILLFLLLIPTIGFSAEKTDDFSYFSEQFGNIKILRYRIPGFENLTLNQKIMAYHLSQAGMAGRDIFWDQNYKHNLTIRSILEQIVRNFIGDRNSELFKNFMEYTKYVWFSNGIHHHYGNDKLMPNFSKEDLVELMLLSPDATYPLREGEIVSQLIDRISPIIFDPNIDSKKVVKDITIDNVTASAVNFYDGVTKEEVEAYYKSITDENDPTPISYGLNSKKVKKDGQVFEMVYKVGGLYTEAIEKIVEHLKNALPYAETELQKASMEKLIKYYETGDLKIFDEYSILWAKDTLPILDFINGFIEFYDDPLGHTGTWESVVSIKDVETTNKFEVIGHEAQWFEDNSPTMPEHKRTDVKGVSYKVITVVSETGGSSPSTPIGINLPNADWIRKNHGSKSVSLINIEHAYDMASTSNFLEEFYLPEQQVWIKEYGNITGRLHTGLHEVVGHASGQLEPNVQPPRTTLKHYANTLEEGRADLVALYYIGDQHLVDIGVSPNTEIEKAEYTKYINNGLLTQLIRIDLGKDIEEDHMRNRQMISRWVFEHGQSENVIERRDIETSDGVKTYFVVNDFQKLRGLFGELLREVQRIKSQGDFEAGKNMVENYAVKIDPELHAQVKRRAEKFGSAAYSGFINPVLERVLDSNNNIIDITVSYPSDFTQQMLDYSQNYSFLPNYPK